MAKAFQIRDWPKHFENNRTRELKYLDWVRLPNKMDGDGYTEFTDHPDAAAHFGAWIAIVEIASRCDPRGTLLRDGATGQKAPHTPQSLARISRLPAGIFEIALKRLVSVGWVELVEIPHDGAGLGSHHAAGECVSSADGTERNGIERNGAEQSGAVAERSGASPGESPPLASRAATPPAAPEREPGDEPDDGPMPSIAEVAAELGIPNPIGPTPPKLSNRETLEQRRVALKRQVEVIGETGS